MVHKISTTTMAQNTTTTTMVQNHSNNTKAIDSKQHSNNTNAITNGKKHLNNNSNGTKHTTNITNGTNTTKTPLVVQDISTSTTAMVQNTPLTSPMEQTPQHYQWYKNHNNTSYGTKHLNFNTKGPKTSQRYTPKVQNTISTILMLQNTCISDMAGNNDKISISLQDKALINYDAWKVLSGLNTEFCQPNVNVLVVLASVPDLQCGFSRDLFLAWCGSARNSIILTNRTSPGTLARYLIENPQNRTVTMEIRRRVKLEGAELDEFMKKKQDKENEEARKKAQERRELEDESSDESEAEMDIDVYSTVGGQKAKHDLMMKSEGKSRTGFFKHAKKAYPMFPYSEEKVKWDEYGEIIRPEDYTILEVAPADEETTAEKKVKKEDESMIDLSEVPTKCVAATVTLDINANIQYIDFEGRSDGESMKKIISQIRPKQLVNIILCNQGDIWQGMS
ncbi:CFT2 [Mytilus edulis]|uniref:Cleavage and polyadenylation specificity factor subunit 2 n=1 Tax=Mytilus edulis TaxID=6550 RepID=A0A8S3T3E8_MYTED|nr:CFT2 [Mytilus edulis]